jgi:hypothetical protein
LNKPIDSFSSLALALAGSGASNFSSIFCQVQMQEQLALS